MDIRDVVKTQLTSRTESFATVVCGFWSLTIDVKISILDDSRGLATPLIDAFKRSEFQHLLVFIKKEAFAQVFSSEFC